MNIPADLKYARSDEWVRVESLTATIGITDYAQEALSDIVYVELPEVGAALQKGDSYGSVESVKAASDVYLPASGTITEINPKLAEAPELLNKDPYGDGWMAKFSLNDPAELDNLMNAEAYQKYCEERKA
jgi:glycine cleavage system H protein